MFIFSTEQYLFDRILLGLRATVKYAWKLLLYSPLIFTAYIISSCFLNNGASTWAWLTLILLISLLLYRLMCFLKGFIINLKDSGKLLWIPLLLTFVFFTSILPVWLMFDDLYQMMQFLYMPEAKLLTWLSAGTLSVMMYSRYHFK